MESIYADIRLALGRFIDFHIPTHCGGQNSPKYLLTMNQKEIAKHIASLDSVAGVGTLIREIKKLDDKGQKIILRAISTELTEGKKQQVLMLLKSEVNVTDKAVRDWLVKGISSVYVSGANFSVKQLKSIGFKPVAGMPALKPLTVEMLQTAGSMKPHLDAVNNLLSEAYLNFGSTMTGYVKGAERILNNTIKRQVRSKIAEGRLEGASVREIKNIVKESFSDTGFTVLLDRGGRQWTLDRYSEMITRTHLLEANNEGVINRASDFQVDIVEVSSHGATDALCAEQEGKIYSISGNSEEHEPLGDNEPPFHPNCAHTLLLRPDLS